MDFENSEQLIGVGVLGLFFIVFPLFSYYRWKDKDIKNYMLTKENLDKIDWNKFSENTSIFTYDYEKIKQNFQELGEEIIAKALHPKRIFKLIEEYGEDEIYNIYFDDLENITLPSFLEKKLNPILIKEHILDNYSSAVIIKKYIHLFNNY